MIDDADFDALLSQAWDQHDSASQAVAKACAGPLATAAQTPARLLAVAHLCHHVWGEHLHDWPAGLLALENLGQHPENSDSVQPALARYSASLRLCAGEDLTSTTPDEQIRVRAMAAANLAGSDAARAGDLLKAACMQADAQADAQKLASDDPAGRALAVAANNIAAALERQPQRNETERALMIQAAETARQFWARAGGWLEVERAEYRLSNTWRVAGDAERALDHAHACLALVQEHQAPPLESFFGLEALALAEQALADEVGMAQAVAQAEEIFETLDPADQGWCRATLDQLLKLQA